MSITVTAKLNQEHKDTYVIKESGSSATYTVSPTTDGYGFYEISASVGKLPAKLQGRYTKPEQAVKELSHHLKVRGASKAVQRDKKYRKNHATADESGSKGHVQ